VLATVVLAVGVGLGAVVVTRAASAAPASAPLPVAYNGAVGWHQGRARPPVIYIGQSNVFVRTPHWSRWSDSSAQTRGELWVNTCTPTCSAGHYRTYPAQVSFSRVAVHDGVRYFTQMTLRYRHGHQRDTCTGGASCPGRRSPAGTAGLPNAAPGPSRGSPRV